MKKIYVLLVLAFFAFTTNIIAQTTLISSTGDGGFENGGTFAANGWTESNSVNNPWVIGGAVTTAPFSGKTAYISDAAGGATNTYTPANNATNFFYRDVTVPAGETKITLSFNWAQQGENSYDIWQVFTAPTSITPVGVATHAGFGTTNVPAAIAGATYVGNGALIAGVQTATFTLPASLSGTTFRLIFSWKNETGGTQPPAAIDNILLISSSPSTVSSTAIGGLWSNPATWIGGVVPNLDDVIIADGATVVVDQVVNIRDLAIGGGTSGILHWNATASALTVSRNLLVNAGANLNMFTAAAAHPGVSVNVGGNFTNNGTIHAAMAAATITFNSTTSVTPSNLNGSGVFVGGIIGQLVNTSTGGVTINTSQNIITRALVHAAGALNTNGKLSIDNTATIFGAGYNQQIYNVVVTAMGTGYNTATPPTITIASPSLGTTATATPVIDNATGTLRSILVTNPGVGYTTNPVVTISGGTGTGATAIAVNNRFSSGLTASSIQKSGIATIAGGINIRSEQSVGAVASSTVLGVGYTTAPLLGFSLPFGYQNLVTAGGSGYTTAPTITVTGGTSLAGVTNPTFTVVVAQGKVVSVIAATGGTFWTSPPTLTVTGGGGTGATLAYQTNTLTTATATIANGAVNGYTVTNAGFGYTAAPTVSLVGGGFTTAATAFSAVALYNLTLNAFTPAPSNAAHTETGIMPANRRINILSVTNALAGSAFTGNVEIYGAAPLVLTTSLLSFGSNTLFASHPTYAGTTGTLTNNITGNITLSSPGGSVTRTFPFDAPLVVATGTGSLATGSTINTLTASRTTAPTGTVSPSGNPIGSRAYRVVTNASAVYGTAPTVALNYNGNDGLISDQQSLFVAQAAAQSGPWTVRSLTSGTGALPATGTRTTATAVPGPIVPTGNDFFAWTSAFVAPPALNYTVTRTTSNTYQSIAPSASGGDGTGTLSTATGDETAQIGINITAAGFIYQGAPVTTMAIHPNGFIVLNNSYYPTYVQASSWDNTLSPVNNGFAGSFDGNKRNVIAPFYDDLNKATPVIYYKISGTKVTAEWFNTTFFGLSGPQLFYQVVLDAADQSITFNYGNMQLYNGTQNIRYSYTSGISGAFVQAIPQAGQVMQQQYENTTYFSNENSGTANWGANGLAISPAPRSSIKFTPGAYVPVGAPTATAPLNDEPAGAITRPALPGFPSNIAWDNGTNTSNLFTTRFATNTATPANCGGAANAKDVWFKFVAPNPSVTVRIYGSGGFIPRVSVYDNALTALPNCVVGTQGLIANTAASGLTVGNTYYVRVYHENTGTQATATATVSGGVVTGLTITGGTNYSNPATAFSGYSPQNQGPRINITGGGGNGAAAGWTTPTTPTAVLPLTGSNIAITGGAGYTSTPTVTIESPDWGITGEFGIVLFSLPENDDCVGAKNLTNLTNTSCTTGQNSLTDNTQGASASAEATVCGTPDDDLWYKFTAVDTKTHVQVQGTGLFDAAFQVYDGGAGAGACATKTAINCINVTGVGAVDSTTMTTIVGNTYFVRVFHAGVGSAAGETFTICVRTIPNLTCATNTSPADLATNVTASPSTTLTWTAVVGASNYDVYYGTVNPPTTIINATTNTLNVPGLLSNTLYYWYVVPKYLGNSATGCVANVTSFTTAQICDIPTAVSSNTIGATSANITFTSAGTAFIVEYGLAGFTPGTGATAGAGGTVVTGASSPIAISGLIPSTLYNVYVRQDCTASALGFSANTPMYSFTTLLINDNCVGAITIPHSSDPSICTNTAGTTLGATQSTDASTSYSSSNDDDVWYSFTATSTIAVINLSGITLASGTLPTAMGIGFHDNGCTGLLANEISNNGLSSTITGGAVSYTVSNLTIGNVYKVRVLTIGTSGTVTFNLCVTVPSVTPGVLNACTTGNTATIGATNNNIWVPLFGADGSLIAEINANGNNLGVVTPSVYTQTGALRSAPQGGAYMNRNIGIEVATPPAGLPVSVRLYFTDAEKAALDAAVPGTNNRADIVMTKEAGGCTAVSSYNGSLISQSGNSAYGASNHYVQLEVSSFSEFFLHKGLQALPVAIDYLNGTKQSNGNIIDWKISCTSIPEVTIELQRSNDSRNYRGIYTEVATSVRCLQAFVYNDASPAAGINYYRLKLTEPNGAVKYSSIIALINKDKGYEIVSLAPNPARANATLTLSSAKAGKVDIVITDVVGKVISKQQNTLISGNNIISMNFEKLSIGSYNIVVTSADGEVKTTRFVKY